MDSLQAVKCTGCTCTRLPSPTDHTQHTNAHKRTQYSLYPDALVPAMVDEVGQALTWMLNNAEAYGGDPKRVRLLDFEADSLH